MGVRFLGTRCDEPSDTVTPTLPHTYTNAYKRASAADAGRHYMSDGTTMGSHLEPLLQLIVGASVCDVSQNLSAAL